MYLVPSRKETLLDLFESFLWLNKLIFLGLVSPFTKLLMSEIFKLFIPALKCPDDFTKVWFPNLLLHCSVNHWPKCWGFPIDILTLFRTLFWGFAWLTSLLLFLMLECCNNKLFGVWGSSNLQTCWDREIRCRCLLINDEYIINIIEHIKEHSQKSFVLYHLVIWSWPFPS